MDLLNHIFYVCFLTTKTSIYFAKTATKYIHATNRKQKQNK